QVTPPTTTQVGGVTPPSTTDVDGVGPPATEVTPPSTDQVDGATPPGEDADAGVAPQIGSPSDAAAQAAVRPSVPDEIVGTFSYHEPRGFKIPVGFSPCGHFDPVLGLPDPLAQYYGRVVRGHRPNETWVHSPRRLNEVMQQLFGLELRPQA